MKLVQWLLVKGGSSIAEAAPDGETAWSLLRWPSGKAFHNACGPSSLAKIMLLMGDPPPSQGNDDDDAARLLRSRASSLREALPGWRHRRAEVVCGAGVLPEALMAIVAEYSEPSVVLVPGGGLERGACRGGWRWRYKAPLIIGPDYQIYA